MYCTGLKTAVIAASIYLWLRGKFVIYMMIMIKLTSIYIDGIVILVIHNIQLVYPQIYSIHCSICSYWRSIAVSLSRSAEQILISKDP